MIVEKLILLSYPFWSYKQIARFYDMSIKKAIEVKKDVEMKALESNKRTINTINSDVIEAHLIVMEISKKTIKEKIEELSNY